MKFSELVHSKGQLKGQGHRAMKYGQIQISKPVVPRRWTHKHWWLPFGFCI